MADSTTIPALRYAHEIEGERPDIQVLTIYVSKEDLLKLIKGNSRIFTLSDVSGYYPLWAEDTETLKSFSISQREHIFEIELSKSPE
jgi:hypothetical protein